MKLILGATDGITTDILDQDDFDQDQANMGMSGYALVCRDATPLDAAIIVHRVNCYDDMLNAMRDIAHNLEEYMDGVWDGSEGMEALIGRLHREISRATMVTQE